MEEEVGSRSFAGSEMSGITGIEVPVTERFSIGRKVVGTEKRESILSLASRSMNRWTLDSLVFGGLFVTAIAFSEEGKKILSYKQRWGIDRRKKKADGSQDVKKKKFGVAVVKVGSFIDQEGSLR